MAVITGTSGNDDLTGASEVADVINGLGGDDTIRGGGGFGNGARDVLSGGDGNDRIILDSYGEASGGPGDDLFVTTNLSGSWDIDGGAGSDTISLAESGFSWRYNVVNNQVVIEKLGASARFPLISVVLASFRLSNIELIQTKDGVASLPGPDDFFSVYVPRSFNAEGPAAHWDLAVGSPYAGPVAGLQRQLLGTASGDVFVGSGGNDFVNTLGGDDAVDGAAGNDVLDGGLGSNFLTGGAGMDTFFLDGRGGEVTWSTIVDWQAGEQLSVWGFRPGVTRLQWVDRDGAVGYEGATLHADLDADGRIDASVTFAGQARAALPTPREYDGLLWFS